MNTKSHASLLSFVTGEVKSAKGKKEEAEKRITTTPRKPNHGPSSPTEHPARNVT